MHFIHWKNILSGEYKGTIIHNLQSSIIFVLGCSLRTTDLFKNFSILFCQFSISNIMNATMTFEFILKIFSIVKKSMLAMIYKYFLQASCIKCKNVYDLKYLN